MWSRRDRVLVEFVWDEKNIEVAMVMKRSGIGRVNFDHTSNRLALIGKLSDISRSKIEIIEY